MELNMNPSVVTASEVAINRTLRNTYGLLALSMLPTVLGAWIGIQAQFSFMAGRPLIGTLLFMAIAFGFFWAIEKTKNSVMGVVLLLVFTGFMGLMLSGMLQFALTFSNGPTLIMAAAGLTGTIFFGLATLATVSKRDFGFLGKFLFIGLLLAIVTSIANIWLQLPALHLAVSGVCVLLFSAYILYDVNRIVRGGETNYVTATLNIYLDIYNLFVHLLSLLLALFGDRD